MGSQASSPGNCSSQTQAQQVGTRGGPGGGGASVSSPLSPHACRLPVCGKNTTETLRPPALSLPETPLIQAPALTDTCCPHTTPQQTKPHTNNRAWRGVPGAPTATTSAGVGGHTLAKGGRGACVLAGGGGHPWKDPACLPPCLPAEGCWPSHPHGQPGPGWGFKNAALPASHHSRGRLASPPGAWSHIHSCP